MRLFLVFVALLFLPLTQSADSEELCAVGLFEAQQAGQVSVRFIALNSKAANVLIRNEGDAPIDVQLPRIFGAKPVLAQIGQIGAPQIGLQGIGQQGGQNGGQNGGSQQVGGAFGQNGGQQNGFGQMGGNQMGGLMRIEPQKTRKVSAMTVCLEHGKPDPHPKRTYQMVPLETLTTDQTIAEALVALGQNEITQTIAQAIAWHKANGLSWEKLATLNRSTSRYRPATRFFGKSELFDAQSFVMISRGNAGVAEPHSESADTL